METLYGFYNPKTGEDQLGRIHVWHELSESPRTFSSERRTMLEHRGERPIAITWPLRTSMPAADFAAASVVL